MIRLYDLLSGAIQTSPKVRSDEPFDTGAGGENKYNSSKVQKSGEVAINKI